MSPSACSAACIASQTLKTWTADQAIPTVSVIAPAPDGGGQTLALPGNVQAFNNAPIHARVSGYLKRWYATSAPR